MLAFREQLNEFYEAMSKHLADADFDATTAAAMALDMARLKTDLDIIDRDVKTVAIDKMHDETIVFDDGAAVEKTWEKPRKAWRHKDVAAEVIHRLIARNVDPETGEMPSATDVASQILDYAGVSYWKVTMLRRLEIDPSKYCEEGELQPKLMIRK
jgi:hypothetical protein